MCEAIYKLGRAGCRPYTACWGGGVIRGRKDPLL
jgi:hypothetical protein